MSEPRPRGTSINFPEWVETEVIAAHDVALEWRKQFEARGWNE